MSEKSLIYFLERNSVDQKKGICFITNSVKEENLSYNELLSQALERLGYLQYKGVKAGEELIFLIDDNKEFLIFFWACILGRIIPVPLALGNSTDHKVKVIKVWNKLNSPWIITDTTHWTRIINFCNNNNFSNFIHTAQRKVVIYNESNVFKIPGKILTSKAEDIALIQFSSGSTGSPKGVMLTHENLIINTQDLARKAEITSEETNLSWMPLTHDMGLICIYLKGFVSRMHQYLIPTSTFIRRPLLWFDKASQHKVSILYTPNFGLNYSMSFLEKGKDYSWDLSSVRLIFNGAEPISYKQCNEFLNTFDQYSLKRSSMYPVYGLAEATVAVSLSNPGDTFKYYFLDRSSLEIGRQVRYLHEENGHEAANFVDVGAPIDNVRLRITDGQNMTLSDNTIGHVQIKGPNVTSGYYNEIPGAKSPFLPDGWFDTGDLGFMTNNGTLVLTGRVKSVIIINGQNYYPQDIEWSITERVMGLAVGKVVACGFRAMNTDREELIIFVAYKKSKEDFEALARGIRRVVFNYYRLEVKDIVTIYKIPKTTSGKIQYFKLLELYASGKYSFVM